MAALVFRWPSLAESPRPVSSKLDLDGKIRDHPCKKPAPERRQKRDRPHRQAGGDMKKTLGLILLLAAATTQAQGLTKSIGGSSSSDTSASQDQQADTFDEGKKYMFYVGADLQNPQLSISNSASYNNLQATSYDSRFWDLRVGYRLFKAIGVEVHYGIQDKSDDNLGDFKVRNYYGVFAVPTANVFNLFELAFPLGYTNSGVTINGTTADGTSNELVQKHLNSIAYGARAELPIRVFWNSLPNIRLTGGGMVYYQRSDAREYGFNFGLRYDFGFGTPSS
jgi:hypothetical protein